MFRGSRACPDLNEEKGARVARSYKTMVVKIGSSTLVGKDRALRRDFIAGLANQAARLAERGWRLVVVSSGAIACGAPVLGFDARPTDMPSLQACASVGQCVLSAAYDEEFRALEQQYRRAAQRGIRVRL